MRHRPVTALLLLLAAACQGRDALSPLGSHLPPSSAKLDAAPADGNGNKTVFPFNISDQTTCDNGATLTRTESGWIQVVNLDAGNSSNVALGVFHDVIGFTNANGESYAYEDVGPDRLVMQDGRLLVMVIGRAGGHIGTFTIDPTTGDVLFSAGPDIASPTTLACAALS